MLFRSLVSYVGLYFADTKLLIFIFIALIGIGNANLFPVLFSLAVQSKPEEENRISVLMIMGQAGGAFFPYFMGLAFDKAGLDGSISVIMIAVVYLMFFSIKLKNKIVLK